MGCVRERCELVRLAACLKPAATTLDSLRSHPGYSMPLPKSPDLVAVAAITHVAPVAASIAARVKEQPSTFLPFALPEPVQIWSGQQVRRSASNGPEHSVKRFGFIVPGPIEGPLAVAQPLMLAGNRELSLEDVKICLLGLPALQDRLEDAIESPPQSEGSCQHRSGVGWMVGRVLD